jgi:RNA polymerase sigma-70 factor, ECF subfamily
MKDQFRKSRQSPTVDLLCAESPSDAFRSHHAAISHLKCRFGTTTEQFAFPRFLAFQDFSRCGVSTDGARGSSGTNRLREGRLLLVPRSATKRFDGISQERRAMRCQLMARTQAGDRESCRALLDDIGPMLTNFLRRRIADRNELEDVYQETLMAFFQARHTYEPSRPLEPWLFAIARNVAADHTRRYWTRASVEQLTERMPDRGSDDEPGFDPSLEDAMARLPKQQREAFSMLKLEGLSIEQAAERVGTSVGALRVRAHRAYKALRKLINE